MAAQPDPKSDVRFGFLIYPEAEIGKLESYFGCHKIFDDSSVLIKFLI